MKLQIITEITELGLPHELGISNEREIELMSLLYEMHKEVVGTPEAKSLTPYYGRIAEICNNIEEYTMCLHLFIFYLARHGALKDETDLHENKRQAANN
jgi:hypothetical protein